MLITTIEELRLASPAHALDSLDGLAGTLDNSEHEFLKDKLGTPLYDALCAWYAANPNHDHVITTETGYYNQLLLLAQRCIAFDTLGRSIGMQLVSVHNSGVNVPTAEDYDKPKKEDIEAYRDTCTKESHAALNRLLQTLEQWTQEVTEASSSSSSSSSSDDQSSSSSSSSSSDDQSSSSSSSSSSDDQSSSSSSSSSSDDLSAVAVVPSDSSLGLTEQEEIVALWRHSRYFYLAAQLLIPSAVVLQQYINFYENREKFIQMLPDLQFIQEEIIQPAIGDDLTEYLVDFAVNNSGPQPALCTTTIHRLRKVMAALLQGRTSVLKYTKDQKISAHDDGVRMMQTAITYIRNHQADFPEDVIKTSPLYVPAASTPSDPQPAPSQSVPASSACSPQAAVSQQPSSDDDAHGAACWTPPLF